MINGPSTDQWGNYSAAASQVAPLVTMPLVGGTNIQFGIGSPAGVVNATAVNELYIDTTGHGLYVASSTGTGGWNQVGSSSGAALVVPNVAVDPNGVTTGTAIGQVVWNNVLSKLWMFEGTVGQNTGWIQLI
jgi:hypothetical protein